MIRDLDLLAVARQLAATGETDEAARRSAVSRAYYAAYHRCLGVATERGYRFRRELGKGSHAVLLDFLRQSDDVALRHLVRPLRVMKEWRTEADYALHTTVPMRRVREAIGQAEHILAAIPSPDPT